jgi:hypothetical protein
MSIPVIRDSVHPEMAMPIAALADFGVGQKF